MDGIDQAVKTVGWFGESWGFWIQTGAVFLSAIAAVAVIYYNGKQARLRALIDLLIEQKNDKALMDAKAAVQKLHTAGNPWTSHLAAGCAERNSILLILNNQEFIAVGVRMGAFDENAYKQLQCSNVLRLWADSKGFIQEIRTERKQETLFQDFEKLAIKWKSDPIKQLK